MEHRNSVDPIGTSGFHPADRDSATGARFDASESGAVVRAVIHDLDSVATDGAEPVYSGVTLAAAARRICAAARSDGFYVEQALVRVKEVWRSTPGRPKPRAGGTDPVLDQLVSACIREFYTER
jgi:hypothetical protein